MLHLPPCRQVPTCRVSWWAQHELGAAPLAVVLAYMSSLPLSLQVLHQLCNNLIPEIFCIVFSLFPNSWILNGGKWPASLWMLICKENTNIITAWYIVVVSANFMKQVGSNSNTCKLYFGGAYGNLGWDTSNPDTFQWFSVWVPPCKCKDSSLN